MRGPEGCGRVHVLSTGALPGKRNNIKRRMPIDAWRALYVKATCPGAFVDHKHGTPFEGDGVARVVTYEGEKGSCRRP